MSSCWSASRLLRPTRAPCSRRARCSSATSRLGASPGCSTSSRAQVIDALRVAVDVGLVFETRPGHFSFSHIVVRDAVAEATGAQRAAELHAGAEALLAGEGEGVDVIVERARHALASMVDGAGACDLARRAARGDAPRERRRVRPRARHGRARRGSPRARRRAAREPRGKASPGGTSSSGGSLRRGRGPVRRPGGRGPRIGRRGVARARRVDHACAPRSPTTEWQSLPRSGRPHRAWPPISTPRL